MENFDNLFAESCFLPCIGEIEKPIPAKSMDTLLEELQDIKERIETIKEKEWNLARKMEFLKAGF